MTTIASPIAASAAATVITRNAKICPAFASHMREKAMNSRFAALNISSMLISMTSGLRRSTTPATPMKNITEASAT